MKANFLQNIIEHKKQDLEIIKAQKSLNQLIYEVNNLNNITEKNNAEFLKALSDENNINIIAEIKRFSPSKGALRPDLNPIELAQTYKEAGAKAISVLTERHFFKGHNQDLEQVKQKVKSCRTCGAVSETEMCNICSDTRRDLSIICVVEEAKDISSLEKTREFKGRYHVLGGVISPIDGIGPDQLRIKELINRVTTEESKEVIVATNPNLEGEATAAYLVRVLESTGVLVTRLASGLPVGGELEYADEVTLGRALKGRRQVS